LTTILYCFPAGVEAAATLSGAGNIGELDSVAGQQVLFRRIAGRDGTMVLIATLDLTVDVFADEVFHLQDGCIIGGISSDSVNQ
jgi:hypothetical protein